MSQTTRSLHDLIVDLITSTNIAITNNSGELAVELVRIMESLAEKRNQAFTPINDYQQDVTDMFSQDR